MTGGQEVPPNGSLSAGSGSLTLSSSFLSFSVSTVFAGGSTPTDGALFDSATGGTLVFDLGTPTINSFGPYIFASFSGGVTLTTQEITDLEAGQDYINILSSAFPTGEIRGEVTIVPEPSSIALVGLGTGMAWMARRKRS